MAAGDVFPRRDLPGRAEEWGRTVEGRIEGAEKSLRVLGQDVEGLNRSIASSLQGLSRQLLDISDVQSSLPFVSVGYGETTGFGLGAPVVLSFDLYVPAGKTTMSLNVVGNAQALDTTSGGLAVASGVITLSGAGVSVTSPTFSASKDAGASAVNNIIAASTGRQVAVNPEESVTVTLTLTASNPSAFPVTGSNFAVLNATAIFTP